ncbi:MAG: DNA-processing protein DprA, partial [Chitinophagaceae bacterium]
GIGTIRAREIKQFKNFGRVEEELNFIEKHGIKVLFYQEKEYPKRLKNCYDCPLVLYYAGNADLNTSRILSVVGTRHYTDYGKDICENIIGDFSKENVLIVSGLAYGIDVIAHKKALKEGLKTIGVVAHGLDRIYPPLHEGIARQMIEQGGLLTEYLSKTLPDKQNFPMRNRIVAGVADATLVIETGIKGGSNITIELANDYNRDVFAVPGKVGDKKSEGCNYLIRKNKAALITSAKDIMEMMGWEEHLKDNKPIKKELFIELSEKEQNVVNLLTGVKMMHVDEIHLQSRLSSSETAAAILNLELQGVIKSLPGKLYKLG